jgi:hypothetical protein
MSHSFQNINTAYSEFNSSSSKSLGYNTNNKYPEFPPLMNDGRTVTASYQPEAVLNQEYITRNNIKSNWEYRRYLTDKAKDIMAENFRESCNDSGYITRYADLSHSNENGIENFSSPRHFETFLDNTKGFGYASSDLKDLYLSREQLASLRTSSVMTQDELLHFRK